MHHDFHIWLVEDSETDVRIVERALRECRVEQRLTTIRDGQEALDALAALLAPGAPARPRPDLILLDLNLPGPDGFQVLEQVKGHPQLRSIPVVVLSTSWRDDDVVRAYQAGANTFFRKPAEYPRYLELIALLGRYWIEFALRSGDTFDNDTV